MRLDISCERNRSYATRVFPSTLEHPLSTFPFPSDTHALSMMLQLVGHNGHCS